MPLLNRNNWPPGGFSYFEPKLNWWAPKDGLSFALKARQIQSVRIANPASGLDPSSEACEADLDAYTCARLGNDPAWCIGATNPVMVATVKARKIVPCCGGRRAK